jgi:hypothetical protein
VWIHFSTNDNNTFQLHIACESGKAKRSKTHFSQMQLIWKCTVSTWSDLKESVQNPMVHKSWEVRVIPSVSDGWEQKIHIKTTDPVTRTGP